MIASGILPEANKIISGLHSPVLIYIDFHNYVWTTLGLSMLNFNSLPLRLSILLLLRIYDNDNFLMYFCFNKV